MEHGGALLQEGLHATRHAPGEPIAFRAAPPAKRDRQVVLARGLSTRAGVAAVHLALSTHVLLGIEIALHPPVARRQQLRAGADTLLARPRLDHSTGFEAVAQLAGAARGGGENVVRRARRRATRAPGPAS